MSVRYSYNQGRKIGVSVRRVPGETVCKPSTLTPIKYIVSESLLNVDFIFRFRLDHIDHNKKLQHFDCNYDVVKHKVKFGTRLLKHLNVYVEYISPVRFFPKFGKEDLLYNAETFSSCSFIPCETFDMSTMCP